MATQRKSYKRDRKYYGPYVILSRIGNVSYALELPLTVRIHIVFHVSLLKNFHEGSDPVSTALLEDFCKLEDELCFEDGGDVAPNLPVRHPRQSPSAMKDFIVY